MGDFNPSTEGTKEPEVVQAVIDEINKLGDNHKKNYEELRKSHEELKKLVDESSGDTLAEEKINKLTEDISLRQEALDEAQKKAEQEAQERIDKIELAMKRLPKGSATDGEDISKLARQFEIECLAAGGKGAHFKHFEGKEIDVAGFEGYRKVFGDFLRQKGDERALTPEQHKLLSVGVDPDGGYTVTPEMSNRVVQRLYEMDPIRQLAAIESITSDAIEFPVDWDEAGAEWESETVATSDETTPTFKMKRIPVHNLATRPKATQQLLEDSGINIESWLSNKVGDKFGREEGEQFISGNGIGKPRGFLTYASGTNYGQVEQINMGAAATLTADGFVSVKYALIEQYLNRGIWLMARSTVQAAMKLKNGAGDYIWKPSMIAADPSSAILGLPVRMSTNMPTVTTNALSVALADWKQAYLIVDRLGITVQRDPYTAKPLVEFYFRKRVGGDVINGQAIKIGKCAV